MLKGPKKVIFLILGLVTTILAIVGIFLPLLPTTPFLLLSAYFFSNSSQKLHNWLLEHRVFGPIIKDWNRYGVIRLRAKIISTILIIALFSYTLLFVKVNLYIKILITLIGLSVLIFINSRPSEPQDKINS